MLNHLDDVKKAIDDAVTAATKANNTALVTQLQTASKARTGVFDFLTANYQNDEDGIQRPGKLREDLQGVYFAAQGLITPPVVEALHRANAEYADGVSRYNAFVGTLAPLNTSLKAAGMKSVPAVTVTAQ
jgi:hypothetical protein